MDYNSKYLLIFQKRALAYLWLAYNFPYKQYNEAIYVFRPVNKNKLFWLRFYSF